VQKMTGVNILIDVQNEGADEVEPTIVAAVVAEGAAGVLLASQHDRSDLAALASSFDLEYRVGPAVLADFKHMPTLVLRPGQILNSRYLTALQKQGLPPGIFFLPDEGPAGYSVHQERKGAGAVSGAGAGTRSGKILHRQGESAEAGAGFGGGFGAGELDSRARRFWAKAFGLVLPSVAAKKSAAVSKRSLERRHVSMKATVNGQLGRCIDIHQRGGGFLIAKSNLAIGDRVPVAVECRNTLGAVETAQGVLDVRSIRTATDAGETWRVSGVVEWKTPRDLALVLEHAYIVERFEKPDWTRSASRAPVSIPATVSGHSAECIDLSLGGAAFAVEQFAVGEGDKLKVVLHLANGQNVEGVLRVKGITQSRRVTRVSGTMTWNDDTWLIRHTHLQFKAK
jgi:hypothetical protein